MNCRRFAIAFLTLGLLSSAAPIIEQIDPVLTARERDVVGGLKAGQTNREIAEQLYLSPKTVKSHLDRIYKRLNLSSRHDVARLADNVTD